MIILPHDSCYCSPYQQVVVYRRRAQSLPRVLRFHFRILKLKGVFAFPKSIGLLQHSSSSFVPRHARLRRHQEDILFPSRQNARMSAYGWASLTPSSTPPQVPSSETFSTSPWRSPLRNANTARAPMLQHIPRHLANVTSTDNFSNLLVQMMSGIRSSRERAGDPAPNPAV